MNFEPRVTSQQIVEAKIGLLTTKVNWIKSTIMLTFIKGLNLSYLFIDLYLFTSCPLLHGGVRTPSPTWWSPTQCGSRLSGRV